jgi:16S rRNA (cytosine1402-N4)-methyltransferase
LTGSAAHESVLAAETLALLAPAEGETFVDGTLGAGGHAEALLEAVGPSGRVVGIDRDPEALEIARDRLASYGDAFVTVHGNHQDLAKHLASLNIETVDGILLDLGVSSMQLDRPHRGFSFRHDGPLDMRMDSTSGPSAAEFLATVEEDELSRILWRYGEERRSRAIARAVVAARSESPIETTRQLAEIVERTLGPAARRFKIHPATRTFLALRVALNNELDDLQATLEQAVDALASGGRLAVISFHSLEDRVVKHTLRSLANRCTCPPRLPVCGCNRPDLVALLTARPVCAGADEVARNPRARSAKLRGVRRL